MVGLENCSDAAGMHFAYSSDAVPAKVARIKKHPLMLELVDRYLDRTPDKIAQLVPAATGSKFRS